MKELHNMTGKELAALVKDAQKLAAEKHDEEKKLIRKQVTELISEAGYSVEDIFPDVKPVGVKRTGPKGEVKFRDPAEHMNTWTGRGRKPRWLLDAEAAGRNQEEFLV